MKIEFISKEKFEELKTTREGDYMLFDASNNIVIVENGVETPIEKSFMILDNTMFYLED